RLISARDDDRWRDTRHRQNGGDGCGGGQVTPGSERGTDGVVLLGWKTRDRALALLQQDCEFDPPLRDDAAEALWARYRERVNKVRGRRLDAASPLTLSAEEARVVADFMEETSRHGGPTREVIKVDPLGLVAHQLEITTGRSRSTAQRVQTAADWAAECLCPAGSSVTPA